MAVGQGTTLHCRVRVHLAHCAASLFKDRCRAGNDSAVEALRPVRGPRQPPRVLDVPAVPVPGRNSGDGAGRRAGNPPAQQCRCTGRQPDRHGGTAGCDVAGHDRAVDCRDRAPPA
ncbi:hypothetical protein G6F21_014641 [Rhizopus arrhizus]|nr:hypothetical protein G6F21_014641 [Rhizopus arrhizus]